ncbi:hypothetical protein [Actinomadura sp. 9N407]|uniref:hypothetical protein n=1 Tax=Actinomadura sp. 9N407 TaxID=3375154 RepID=UPI0037AEED8A
MGQAQVHRRRSAVWHVLGYVSLVAVTGAAAVVLLPLSVYLGDDWFYDPQDDTERLAAWRGAAVMGVTAGSEVGYLCALVAGMLAARVRPEPRRAGLLTAVGAGAGLAVVNVTVAWLGAVPRLHEWREQMTNVSSLAFLDADLWDHGPVYAAIALVAIAFLIAASMGFGVALVKPPALKMVVVVAVLTVSVVFAPIAHYMMPMVIVP